MILIHSTDPPLLARLHAAVPCNLQIDAALCWSDVLERARRSRCSVVAAECLKKDSVVPKLRAFATIHPDHSVILVTALTAPNGRLLTGLRVDEVVWLPEVEHTLPAAVQRLCSANQLASLCTLFNTATRLPGLVREALSLACRSEVPFHSVQRLADAVGSNRRTLWRQWHRAVGPACDLHLEDMLHWLLLLRAVNVKTSGRS